MFPKLIVYQKRLIIWYASTKKLDDRVFKTD
jgi:hypothetical protein